MRNYKINLILAVMLLALVGCNVDDDAAPVSEVRGTEIEFSLRDTGVVRLPNNASSATNSFVSTIGLPFNTRVDYTVDGSLQSSILNPGSGTSFDFDIPLTNGRAIVNLVDVRMNFESSSGNRGVLNEDLSSVAYVTTDNLFFQLAWESNSDLDFRVSTPADPDFFQSGGIVNPEGATFPITLPEDVYTVSITPFTTTPTGDEEFSWLAVSPSSNLVRGSGSLSGATPFTGQYSTVVPILEVERSTNANGEPIFIVRDIF